MVPIYKWETAANSTSFWLAEETASRWPLCLGESRSCLISDRCSTPCTVWFWKCKVNLISKSLNFSHFFAVQTAIAPTKHNHRPWTNDSTVRLFPSSPKWGLFSNNSISKQPATSDYTAPRVQSTQQTSHVDVQRHKELLHPTLKCSYLWSGTLRTIVHCC